MSEKKFCSNCQMVAATIVDREGIMTDGETYGDSILVKVRLHREFLTYEDAGHVTHYKVEAKKKGPFTDSDLFALEHLFLEEKIVYSVMPAHALLGFRWLK